MHLDSGPTSNTLPVYVMLKFWFVIPTFLLLYRTSYYALLLHIKCQLPDTDGDVADGEDGALWLCGTETWCRLVERRIFIC